MKSEKYNLLLSLVDFCIDFISLFSDSGDITQDLKDDFIRIRNTLLEFY